MSAKFDPSISLGHVITAGSMLVTLAVGWGVHATTVTMLQANDAKHERLIEIHAAAIAALERGQERTATSLEYIKSGIDEIKRTK